MVIILIILGAVIFSFLIIVSLCKTSAKEDKEQELLIKDLLENHKGDWDNE